jgi:Kef-type K+ transport system membrane component KefB
MKKGKLRKKLRLKTPERMDALHLNSLDSLTLAFVICYKEASAKFSSILGKFLSGLYLGESESRQAY